MLHVHLPHSLYSAVTFILHVLFCTTEEGPAPMGSKRLVRLQTVHIMCYALVNSPPCRCTVYSHMHPWVVSMNESS